MGHVSRLSRFDALSLTCHALSFVQNARSEVACVASLYGLLLLYQGVPCVRLDRATGAAGALGSPICCGCCDTWVDIGIFDAAGVSLSRCFDASDD